MDHRRQIHFLSGELKFPPVDLADAEGILAMGGDVSPQRVLLAYQKGIFPWYSDETPILWWAPDPRFVLYPENYKTSKSLRQVMRKKQFTVTFDHAFEEVINKCQNVPRAGQDGTWITDELKETFCEIHRLGFSHSVEVWQDGELVGGLFGTSLGRAYFGESMFSLVSNASKVGFATLVPQLINRGIKLIDCQVYTDHLSRFGALNIPRSKYSEHLEVLLDFDSLQGSWKNWSKEDE
ncbi:leucyl/phenylalanyl-tRNA--protein transferase [Salibacter sp.]|uniref:leucyl/phenylalanyl-tRNA--protein transferase n=1 Tax=Salibacter sp. TaxID=2010995 RepID=UPI00286FD324|nr:leucyl/phenylalanyl-tRNA--protein transferase [Salibacter sp.]MDR9398733.1 leucyl/phenylalanyl-tRNA--protein transferase [Salibacter sp.]MDR9486532.1 leucyl/phenylalanyl-tRNA--protein transferase [Salibacter sp.]